MKKKPKAPEAQTQPADPVEQQDSAVARFMCDESGRILHANAEFAAFLGTQTVDKGAALFDYVTIQSAEGPCQTLSSLYAGDYLVTFNQSQMNAQLRFDWVDNADGRRMLIGSTIQNEGVIHHPPTQYHDTERQDGLHGFLDMSHEVLCKLSLDGEFGWMNDTFCGLFKTDGSILSDRGFIDLVHPQDRSFAWQLIHDLHDNDGNAISDFECAMIAGDGDVLHLQWRLKKSGRSLYCVGQDLTAIKRHKDTLRRQEKKLLEAEAIGKMGHWHWRLGEDHFIWSDEIYRIFGAKKYDFIPSIDSVNAMVHRSDSGRIMQVFQRAMIENKDYEMDFRIERPDGGVCYIRCQGRCESDGDGDVLGLYGIMQDITQDTMREQDLREAKDAAESAYAAKSRFLANMSHELRTPLNAIIGFSEMIQNQLLGPVGNERYLEYIGGIRESGEHLLDLISDILDMSKIEAGKYELAIEKFTLSKVVRMAIHMMEGRAVDSSIKLTCDILDEDLQVIADRRAIMQIMLNLLSNAVKFSPNGGEIKTTCTHDESSVSISVSDNGIGIPAHQLQTIMRPFEQVSSHYTREHEGSGLGLAITKELIEMHGGKVNIESKVDHGTTVTLTLPRQEN